MPFKKLVSSQNGKFKGEPLTVIGCGPSYDKEPIKDLRTNIICLNAAITDVRHHHPEAWWFYNDIPTTWRRKPEIAAGYKERLKGWRWKIITRHASIRVLPENADCYFFHWGRRMREKYPFVGSLGRVLLLAKAWGFIPIILRGIDMEAVPDGRPQFEGTGGLRYFAEPFIWRGSGGGLKGIRKLEQMKRSLKKYRHLLPGEIYISRKSPWFLSGECPFQGS